MKRTSPVTGFSHIQLRVSDLGASERWYADVLGLERLVADGEGGYVALRHRPSRLVVVLTLSTGLADDSANERLDHLAFAVPDGLALEAWASELTARGIAHDGVIDELGKPSLTLVDPDGTRVELVAPAGTMSP
jgi:catechol-2,3-dioxygenase